MGRVIVIEFVTVDGVVQDPDGREGSARGGWAFRYGPEAVAGDKFRVGEVMETGALLLGRRTWELFTRIWPSRDDDFSRKMNATPKLVASRSVEDVSAWQNSAVLRGDLVKEVQERKQDQDIVVAGSTSVARTLMEHGLVDEYRLLVFPLMLGEAARLFPGGTPIDLHLVSAEPSGAAAFLIYSVATG